MVFTLSPLNCRASIHKKMPGDPQGPLKEMCTNRIVAIVDNKNVSQVKTILALGLQSLES